MTTKPHAPIYRLEDLAELITAHDREHADADHDRDCTCENGLIAAMRAYFTPPTLGVNPVSPYLPPDTQAGLNRDDGGRKPWLARRDGETTAQYDFRISHSCYNCGVTIVDNAALDRHEDDCSQHGRRPT